MDPLISSDPQYIGPYRLIARLGAGGMGLVYLGRSEAGRTVAVKVVRAEYAQHPEFRRRFAREVAASRRVGGAWTADVLDADTDAAVPWVATQYIPGPDLTTVVAEDFGPLPEDSLRVLAGRLALALRAVHEAGLIHRDLKPSNVLVTVDGPRVIDFGIARAMDSLTGDSLHTRTGMLIGSPGFMSPEQVRGRELTPASDVFCLGAVLVYAATGRLLFGAAETGLNAHLFRVAEEEADLTGVPGPLLGLVGECLDKDPARRPAPEQVAARTAGEEDGVWLPGAVLAQLGRHAARLLDYAPQTAAAGTSGAASAQAPASPPADPRVPSGHPQPPPPPSYAPTAPAHPAPDLAPPPDVTRVPSPADPLGAPAHPRRWWMLLAVALVQMYVLVQAVSLNLALPAVSADMDASVDDVGWLPAAYDIAFGGLLLLGGHLADVLGRRRMLLIGLAGCLVASAAGGVVDDIVPLILAHTAQGAFAALLMPAALALVADHFTDARARHRAFGVYAAIAVGGPVVGQLIVGQLIETLSWRWCLFAGVPFALLGLITVAAAVRDKHVPSRRRLDVPGMLLGSGGIAVLVYGVNEIGERGWSHVPALALLGTGVALFLAFAWWQTRSAAPLLPPYVLGDGRRAASFVTLLLAGLGTMALFPTLIVFLEVYQRRSPVGTALALLPLAVAAVLGATQISARLLHRVPPRSLIVAGLMFAVFGLLFLSRLRPGSDYATLILPAMVLTGLGLGTALMPLYSLALSGVTARDSGGGAALAGTVDQVGTALGATLFASLVSSAIAARAEGLPSDVADMIEEGWILSTQGMPPEVAAQVEEATLGGYATAVWWSVGATMLTGLLAAVLFRSGRPAAPDPADTALPNGERRAAPGAPR